MMKQGSMLKSMMQRTSLAPTKDSEGNQNGGNDLMNGDDSTQDDQSGQKEDVGDWSADEETTSVDGESLLIEEAKDDSKLAELPNPFSGKASRRSMLAGAKRYSESHAIASTLDEFDGDLEELGVRQKHTWRADKSKSFTMGQTPEHGAILESLSSEEESDDDSSGSDDSDSDTDAVIMGSMDEEDREEGQSATGSSKKSKKKKKKKSKKKKKKKSRRSSTKSKSKEEGSGSTGKRKSKRGSSESIVKTDSIEEEPLKLSKSKSQDSQSSNRSKSNHSKSKLREDVAISPTRQNLTDDEFGVPKIPKKSKSKESVAESPKTSESPKKTKSKDDRFRIPFEEGSASPPVPKPQDEGSASLSKSKSRDEGSLRASRTGDKRKKKKKSKSEVIAYNEAAKEAMGALDEKIAQQISSENDAQKNEILKLQQQLSDALHKVVATTEEQIQDKDVFLKVSTEVAELKAQVAELVKARDVAEGSNAEKDSAIEEKDSRIQKLEAAVERQLDLQDELEMKLERSEDEIEKLLHEVEELETGNGDVGAGSRALQAELDQANAFLAEKQKELQECIERIEYLEKEMEEGNNVNKLQVNEMEEMNTALQGKLRGERLDAAAKLSRKDEMIGKLQVEIDNYKRTDDVKDLVSAKERIKATELELEETQAEKDEALEQLAKISGDKEDLVEKFNVLNKQAKIFQQENKELTVKAQESHIQVLQWTEKTYDWKSRAEEAEKNLKDLNEGESEAADAAPQGMFLQAVMDTQAKQARGSVGGLRRWNTLFKKSANDDDDASEENDDLTAEQMRIKNLEETNESLDATIVELRSELAKMESAQKDHLSSLEQQIEQLQHENESLKSKNRLLEQPPTEDSVEI